MFLRLSVPKIILCLLNRFFFFGGGKFLHYDRENRIASKSVVFRYHRYIKLTHSPQLNIFPPYPLHHQ